MIAFKSAQMTSVAMLLIMTLTQSLRAHGQLSESNSKHDSDDDDDDNDDDYYAYDYLAMDDSPRFCNVTASRLLPGDCTWPCTNSSTCPEGSVLDSFEDCELEPWQKALQARSFNVSDSDEGNSSASTEDDSVFDPASLQACRAVCAEDFVDPQCCSGFFGASCLWCPRNEGQVCSGHGQCNDGLEGDGACQCFKNFTGILCEVCTNKEMYGQNCTEECRCVNGYCDNGPTGSGNCTFCFPGFQGSLCDQDIITCHNLTCANNSQCEEVNGESKCVCDPGFKGGDPSNGIACTPINHCEEEGHGSKVCGHGMQCVFTGPGTYECECQEGYEQYGVRCHAINPCLKDNGGCDLETTTCFHTGPNTSQCDCLAYYESYVPDEGCTLVNVCPIANCHANANCTTIGPNEHRCSCLPGYVGDGEKNCFGNIVQRLSELNRQHPTLRGQLSMSLGLIDRLYRTAMEQHGPFTIFIPNNRAYRRARKDFKYADMLKQPRRTRQLLRQHILLGKLTLEDLQGYDNYYTLQGTIADLQVRVAKNVFKYKIRGFSNKVKVISRDFPASNGMIHIVNELLMNEPVIVGDKTKTAMQLIQQEGRFNRLQTLINSLGVDHVFDRDNITVFAPENGGLDNLPEGTLEYLTTDEEGKEKLRTLLENHIFAGRISVTDLVSMKRIHSVANYAFDVSITDVGRIQLMGKVNISQTDIPCRNAVYYHIDGPLIPDELADILPSRCDIVKNTTIKGRCTLCDGDLHCPLKSDKFDGEVAEACYFWGTMSGVVTKVPGCQPICVRTYTIPKCCPGFHGKDCRSCPGGHKNPCNGHGECMDERFGTGFCLCDRNFRGEKCELCMDRKNFGPNCTDPCPCMHGQCDGGPGGSGKCISGTCYADFTGENCELEQKYCTKGKKISCHLHAKCVKDDLQTFRCACIPGYEGDGDVCTEIDPCEKPTRGRCHEQAVCTKIGPGANKCDCDEGWYGDGFDCNPVNPCNATDQCHGNAKCVDIQPGMYTCRCDEGYEGNGTVCSEVDACLDNNGGCHSLASCTPTGPGTVNCTCPENLAGDGQYCYTSVASLIMSHEKLTLLAGLIKKIPSVDATLFDLGLKFTFFAPSDEAMRRFLSEKGDMEDEETIIAFLEFHSLWQDYTVELMIMQGKNGSHRFDTSFSGFDIKVFRQDGKVKIRKSQTELAEVLQADIRADNGFLHVIDDVLAPVLYPKDPLEIRDFFQQNPQYSVFGEWLEDKKVVEDLTMAGTSAYTLFVPTNNACTHEKLNMSITKDYLEYYILDEQWIAQSFDNDQQVPTSGHGEKHMLRFTTNASQVYVNGVNIVKSNLFTAGGVIHVIDGLLRPVLNFCNRRTDKTEFGLCGDCSYPEKLSCKPGFKPVVSLYKVPLRRHRCVFNVTDPSSNVRLFNGCQRLCEKHVEIPQCCAGHYGPQCLECPGGPETPCSGQGICDEGIGGTGHCVCDRLHSGTSCQSCIDPTKAGPGCDINKASCEYQNGNCSANALCVEDQTATEGVPGVRCRCNPGYVGDGYTCTSPCETQNGGCHTNAVCSIQPQASDKAVNCTCKTGYHGNGTNCVENRDRCEDDGGDCSAYADCRYNPPPVTSEKEGKITCACLPGYVGNGTLCVTTVLNALSQIPAAAQMYQTLTLLPYSGYDNITHLIDSHQSAVTIFVPMGAASAELNFNDYVLSEGILLSDDLVTESNSTDTGIYSVSGLLLPLSKHGGQFYVRGARVLDMNVPALNGYVNILATPYGAEDLNIGRSTGSDGIPVVPIVIAVVVLLLLVILVVVGVVCYQRSRASGLLDMVKRFRKGSDASMSFARLKAQESSEEEVHCPFTQPDNANFDNPLYNDPDSS